jgi:hypothetical protein
MTRKENGNNKYMFNIKIVHLFEDFLQVGVARKYF